MGLNLRNDVVLHRGAALMRRTSVFAGGENRGGGGTDFRRALELRTVRKKKDTLLSVSLSVSKKFDTLLKNASIFSRGCSPLRA